MYSRSLKWMAFAMALAVSPPLVATAEEKIEIHRGEEFTSPGAGREEELRFVRVFTVGKEQLATQPKADFRSKPPLSAAKAIELAEASLEPSNTDGNDNAHVTKLELRQPGRDPNASAISVAFYVVDFHVDGSEVQRLVLMDGTVVKPQLTRLPGKPEEKR
jgi:hypothetical protein